MLLLGLRGAADILPKILASHLGQIHQQDKITISQGILVRISKGLNTISHLVGVNTSKVDLIITEDLLQRTRIRLHLVQVLTRDNVLLLLKGFVVKVVGITIARLEDHHGEGFLSHLLQVNSITRKIEDVPNTMLPVRGMNV